MGGTALRAAAAVTSLGGSELTRDKPFQPGKGKVSPFDFVPGGSHFRGLAKVVKPMFDKANPPKPTPSSNSFLSEDEREREARNAASRRKREYQNVGRSSTILTGPSGLGGSGTGSEKTLLGY